jgi:hypothetical protein
MIVLMRKKPMNDHVTIYTRIPQGILIRAGLLSAAQHISRTKVLERAIVDSLGKVYEKALCKKIIRQIKKEIINSSYHKEIVLDQWRRYLLRKGIPIDYCKTIISEASETN